MRHGSTARKGLALNLLLLLRLMFMVTSSYSAEMSMECPRGYQLVKSNSIDDDDQDALLSPERAVQRRRWNKRFMQ